MPATLTESDREKLATFIARVRRVWKDRSPEGRKELERRFEEVVGGMFSDFMWKSCYDDLFAAYQAGIDQQTREMKHALARVQRVLRDAGKRRTIAADSLRLALSKYEQCSYRDATRMVHGQPACEEDYAEMQKRGLA
jgi:hypothetical protein